MKSPRYKFDTEWEKAIDYMAWFDINTQYVKDVIRRYIETGTDPTDEFTGLPVMGVWIVIKAQIDRRKARNERARERRRLRRENEETPKAAVPAEADGCDGLQHENIGMEDSGDRMSQPSEHPHHNLMSRIGAGNNRNVSSCEKLKPKFSDRFLGPGLTHLR